MARPTDRSSRKSERKQKPKRGGGGKAAPARARPSAESETAKAERRRAHQESERSRDRARRQERADRSETVVPLPAGASETVRCKLALHPQGFGFAERDDDGATVFIPAMHRNGAMDGDEVLVAFWSAERGLEGAVRSVVARRRTRLTGVLRRQRGRLWLEPDDPRVVDAVEIVGELPPEPFDMVVLVDIVEYPEPRAPRVLATVDRVLGKPGRLATEQVKILIEHGVDPEFPDHVLEAAKHVPTEVRPEDLVDRADLRHLPFCTIDPPDARDFDDAVCVEQLPKGSTRLHVAVADVSHYVREGDAFDVEAAQRCFSCYLPDRAIPMLPPQLSSNMCSLVAEQDRLAMVVSLDIDARGGVEKSVIAAAVIRSRARLSYEQAAKMLEGGGDDAELRGRVVELRALADRLRKVRLRRGAIELTLPEIKIRLDQDDPERVRAIEQARANPEIARAYNLIEELMLAANEAAARVCAQQRLPTLYRVHAAPDEERIERFCAIAALLAVDVDPESLRSPKLMSLFLKRIAKHPRRVALNGLLLRALAQAEYATANVGHFALASEAYLHFTSPIRRYADLVDHRVLKAWLKRSGGSAGPEPVPKMPERHVATATAVRASERERQVTQAERDAKSMLAAAYMRDRIGDRFEGTVTGMSNTGAFVMLDDPPVDGMIRRNALERETREAFVVDELVARMKGERSGTTIGIGDRVIVELVDASIARRQIELALIRRLVT